MVESTGDRMAEVGQSAEYFLIRDDGASWITRIRSRHLDLIYRKPIWQPDKVNATYRSLSAH